MSLINDMLRNIEHRREQDQQQGPVSSAAAGTQKFTRQRLTLMTGALVLTLMLLLAAGWAYYLPKETATSLRVAAPAADGVIEALPATTVKPVLAAESDHMSPAGPLLTSVGLIDDAQQLRIELTFNLLPAGAEIRSLPQEGRVLIRLPATQLKQGLVVPQPQGENISNISFVPTSAGLDLIVALVAGLQIATSQHFDQHSAKLIIGLDFLTTRHVEVIAEPQVRAETAPVTFQHLTVAQSNSAPPPMQALVRTQLLPETDEQLYQRGLQQVHQGDLLAARRSFAGALRINPERLPARLELIGVLQRLDDQPEALQVIQAGLQLLPAQPELRKLLAHHLLYQQRYQEALVQLEAAPVPAFAADPDYHALRAAIYQEIGEYPQAAQLYARLLEQRPREPLWWMGLAIALDQQGLSGGARDAYRTALDVSGLRPDLEKFVRERLQHL